MMKPEDPRPTPRDRVWSILGLAFLILALPVIMVVVTIRDGWAYVFQLPRSAKSSPAKRGSSGCLIA
jgi:hypothetical protein